MTYQCNQTLSDNSCAVCSKGGRMKALYIRFVMFFLRPAIRAEIERGGERHDSVIRTAMATAGIDAATHTLVLQMLERITHVCGCTLRRPESLFPANLEHNKVNEFSRGMAAAVLEIHFLISKTAEGRQAILDLGFKPLFEDIERPTGGGGQD